MRTVNLIQFTNVPDQDYGYEPDKDRFYKVNYLNDTYYYETEDDEGDTYEEELSSISIFVPEDLQLRLRTRHVVDHDDLIFTLLTIELEDDSKLFT